MSPVSWLVVPDGSVWELPEPAGERPPTGVYGTDWVVVRGGSFTEARASGMALMGRAILVTEAEARKFWENVT